MIRALVGAIALVATAAPPQAGPLKLAVRPTVGIAPAEIWIALHVEPGGRARQVLLELEGGAYYRSSVFPITGNTAAPTVQPTAKYRSIPEGSYIVAATLTDTRCDGCRSRVELARRELRVEIVEGRGR